MSESVRTYGDEGCCVRQPQLDPLKWPTFDGVRIVNGRYIPHGMVLCVTDREAGVVTNHLSVHWETALCKVITIARVRRPAPAAATFAAVIVVNKDWLLDGLRQTLAGTSVSPSLFGPGLLEEFIQSVQALR